MISVSIIALNKEVILPQCLDSARKASDDVVIITNAGHKFVNFADQKNYAASKCKYDWVLSLDADEELSPELVYELRTINYEYAAAVAYRIPRLNIIFGKAILHSNWEPAADTHIWLFDKTKCRWVGEVHEEIVADGPVGQLRGRKIHHSYKAGTDYS
ncbi:MAG: Glycosyl transferase family 2 [Candidatus Amesbacteria bacterium GW2011_GWA2_47_70]|nr:MAG: Glycosyl transferase family 2 [Candidatus Amesbacteria bacterium GW2011_GWA2_47_70]